MLRNVDDAPDRSGPVANERFVRAADQRPGPVFRQVAHDERLQTGAVAVDDAVAVDEREVVVASAGPDFVEAVAGVDPIVAVTAVQVVALAFGLTGRLVVAPDHIAGFTAVNGVVAVATKQPVVDVPEADERVAESLPSLVHLQAFVCGPAGVTGDGDVRVRKRGDAGYFFVGWEEGNVDALVVALELFCFGGRDGSRDGSCRVGAGGQRKPSGAVDGDK